MKKKKQTLPWFMEGDTIQYLSLFGAVCHSGSVARSRKPITSMLKALLITDPVAPNSDTIVDSAVTFSPILIDYEDERR